MHGRRRITRIIHDCAPHRRIIRIRIIHDFAPHEGVGPPDTITDGVPHSTADSIMLRGTVP